MSQSKKDSIEIRLAITSGVIRQDSNNFVKISTVPTVQQEMSNELMTINKEISQVMGNAVVLTGNATAAARKMGIGFFEEMRKQLEMQTQKHLEKNNALAKSQNQINKASYNETNETPTSRMRIKK